MIEQHRVRSGHLAAAGATAVMMMMMMVLLPATDESVLLTAVIAGPELQVDSQVERDEGEQGDDPGDDELVPPRGERDVVLVLVQRGRPVVGDVAHGLQLEFEEAGDVYRA